MIHFARWKLWLIFGLSLLGILYALPNLLPRETLADLRHQVQTPQEQQADRLPGWAQWLPLKTINLGLDLRGGSHLSLEINSESLVRETLENLAEAVRLRLRENDPQIVTNTAQVSGDQIQIALRDPAQTAPARDILREYSGYQVDNPADGQLTLTLSGDGRRELIRRAAEQSIEVIRRRVDATGTTEPSIAREGDNRIQVQVPGLEDPTRLKEILGTTAKLSFHLVEARSERGQRVAAPPGTRWLPSRERPNELLAVQRRVIVSGERLLDAGDTFLEGRPIVSFRFDTTGGRAFGTATTENAGKQLAIVLDGEVISAPVIEEPITGGSGIIRGQFTAQQTRDLALLLRAGALPAEIKIAEERTVGPTLGADSVAAGRDATLIAFAGIAAFVIIGYGLFGIFTVVALILNVIMLFALLSILQATLTLPGIAGIALTIGMAVDANVLIFERMREEFKNGRSTVASIEAGFGRAIGTIVDANLTTLIAAILMFVLGSGPIRGFAVTLTLGLFTSMFTAIMITRLMIVWWWRRNRQAPLPL